MTSQLDLLGGETPIDAAPAPAAPAPRPLTDRQEAALAFIAAAGDDGLSSDDLGAHVHQWNRDQGRRGHDSDTRCTWCGSTGKELGAALRARGLVYQQGHRHWTLVEHRTTTAGRQQPAVPVNEFPEGF